QHRQHPRRRVPSRRRPSECRPRDTQLGAFIIFSLLMFRYLPDSLYNSETIGKRAGGSGASASRNRGSRRRSVSTFPIADSIFSFKWGYCLSRSANMSRRALLTVPVFCEHPQGTTGIPSDCAYAAVISSVTKHSGRISRYSPSRETVTGGNALSLPVNIVLR